MPIYEYRCQDCGHKSSVFVRRIGLEVEPVCESCGSRRMNRLISRVAVLRSEDDIFQGLAEDVSLDDVDESDPRSMARFIRRMSQRLGEPLDAEMEAELERMEAGELPEEEGDDEGASEGEEE
ncbi:MAG: zinc ribbon domain-containing protein [Dehalococcoidia bacterium]|nr:zinc ribbon domain-containing protein [Dehalococcoidia bacterium]MDW8008125.1 FmdB family zinc ribbon protein [Chloroflexota bacterium]